MTMACYRYANGVSRFVAQGCTSICMQNLKCHIFVSHLAEVSHNLKVEVQVIDSMSILLDFETETWPDVDLRQANIYRYIISERVSTIPSSKIAHKDMSIQL